MEYDLWDKIYVIFLKNQLILSSSKVLENFYTEGDRYRQFVYDLNNALTLEPAFFFTNPKILEKAQEIFYRHRFSVKDPKVNGEINEIIGKLNVLNNTPDYVKRIQLYNYLSYQEDSRQIKFYHDDLFLESMANDANVIFKLISGDLSGVDSTYFLGSTNYLVSTIPEFYLEDLRRIELTMAKIDELASQKGFSKIGERAFAKDTRKNIQKIKVKEE